MQKMFTILIWQQMNFAKINLIPLFAILIWIGYSWWILGCYWSRFYVFKYKYFVLANGGTICSHFFPIINFAPLVLNSHDDQ